MAKSPIVDTMEKEDDNVQDLELGTPLSNLSKARKGNPGPTLTYDALHRVVPSPAFDSEFSGITLPAVLSASVCES